MKITVDTSFDKIKQIPELAAAAPYFSGRRDGQVKDEEGKSARDLNALYKTWNPESIIYGISALRQVASAGEPYVFSVYNEQEVKDDPSLKDVKLIRFPGNPDKPAIIICAGGAYHAVCSMVEAFPVAAHFAQSGYNAFCLNYRTYKNDTETLFPKPLDDLAQAVHFILAHRDHFHLNSENYALCGFSAGGNLIDEFGLRTVGYAHYNVPAPQVMFPIYSLLSPLELSGEGSAFMLKTQFGKNASLKAVAPYSVTGNLDHTYPPCYIAAALDDDTVPVDQSRQLAQCLKENGIPYRLELGPSGGHGFGDGRGTSLDGWMDRAAAFWEQIRRK